MNFSPNVKTISFLKYPVVSLTQPLWTNIVSRLDNIDVMILDIIDQVRGGNHLQYAGYQKDSDLYSLKIFFTKLIPKTKTNETKDVASEIKVSKNTNCVRGDQWKKEFM